MGSHCSKVKNTKVIWPVAVSADFTRPGSNEGDEKNMLKMLNEDSTRGKAGKKRDLPAGYDSKSKEGDQGDQVRENHDTNATRSRISDDSTSRKAPQYKKGPILDSKNPFAEVCECLDLITGERLAVKSYKVCGDRNKLKEEIDFLQDEIHVLQDLDHINLIRYDGIEFYELEEEPSRMSIDIVMEYASGGSVWGLLQKFNTLEERVIRNYTYQILEGLAYLHSEGVVHGNLKGSNVLIDSCGTIKLSDIQSTNRIKYFLQEKSQRGNNFDILMDSIYWTAPEVLMKKEIEPPADIWSIGCIIIEMLTGSPPWASKGKQEAVRQITAGVLPQLPNDISELCRDFLSNIFKFAPEERLTAEQLLEHAFVNGLEKLTEASSVCESLQTLQSFSIFRGNTALQSLNSITQNLAEAPNDLQTKIVNVTPNISGVHFKKPTNTRPKQYPIRGKSLQSSPKKTLLDSDVSNQSRESSKKEALPKVYETNVEEEEASPNDRFVHSKNRIEPKKCWEGLQVIKLGEEKPNEDIPNKDDKREFLGEGMRKAKTFQVDQLQNEEDSSDAQKIDLLNNKAPFAPVKLSIFRKLPREEMVHNDQNVRCSIRDLEGGEAKTDSNSLVAPQLSKEEERRRFEEELMNQLLRIKTKDLSQDFSSNFDGNKTDRFEESYGNENDQQPKQVLDREEQRRLFEEEMRRQLERINTKDLEQSSFSHQKSMQEDFQGGNEIKESGLSVKSKGY